MKTKMKIRKSISKRFKVTKNGKVLFRSAFARHLKHTKSRSQMRRHALVKTLYSTLALKIRKLLGK